MSTPTHDDERGTNEDGREWTEANPDEDAWPEPADRPLPLEAAEADVVDQRIAVRSDEEESR